MSSVITVHMGILTCLFAFALLASFLGCSEDTSTNADPSEVQSGELYVDIYDAEKACNGTTLFNDSSNASRPRFVEVDMDGTVLWEYVIPEQWRAFLNPGLDVELLANGNILFVLPLKGVVEIDRNGTVIWSHEDSLISHDADRLPNGNTLYVFGGGDKKTDPQTKEVNDAGEVVWSWYAQEEFDVDPYATIRREGWTHANAIIRLNNGNTLINLRNFGLTTLVATDGRVLRNFDWNAIAGVSLTDPHEPELHTDGNILIALQHESPFQGVEIDTASNAVVWSYARENLRTTRDCDRLPNGNTLMVGVLTDTQDSVIFEVTTDGEIAWQLKVKDRPAGSSPGWFYKAQRICEN